jgi:hypothetical protein
MRLLPDVENGLFRHGQRPRRIRNGDVHIADATDRLIVQMTDVDANDSIGDR